MPLTAAQENASRLTTPLLDTCVVAGPGSGKTTVLIDRYVRLVEAGIRPSRILAITFTERATLNMRQKLTEAFASRGDLLREVEQAWVSTMHGFCLRLLREHAIAAGVDPEFRLLNEAQSMRIQDQASEDALDALYAERPADFRDLMTALDRPNLARDLREVYDAIRAAGIPVGDAVAAAAPEAVDFSKVYEAAARVEAGREWKWKLSQREAVDRMLEWVRGCARLESTAPGSRWFEHLGHFKVNKLSLTSIPVAVREDVKRIRDDLAPALVVSAASAYFAPVRLTLAEALRRFDSLYRRRKREAGVLDFSDLEESALRLLRNRADIRQDVSSQFDQILMDEFQDTNGLQAALLELIRPDGRFYAVGDINQSIYGFRHADPEVFRAYRQHVESRDGRLCELRENWRSRPEILEAVSFVADGMPGIEPHDFAPARDFAPASEPAVEVLVSIGSADLEAADLEARHVARRIRELAGTLLPAKGPARFRDFALLFRTSTPMMAFAEALEREGIPFSVRGGRGFYDCPEVTDLICLLRILANPRDEVSLAGVLRSPFVGVSDETLWRMRSAGNLGEALFAALPAGDPEETQRLDLFRCYFLQWRHGRLPVDQNLASALDLSGYEIRLTTAERANVARFLAETRDALQRMSLDQYLEELDRLRESDPRDADPQSEETADRVILQTMHSAKGLEFPVVILPALGIGASNENSSISFLPGLGLGVKWRNPATGESVRDRISDSIDRRRDVEQEEETNRLLYVAMTRAEERLILSWSTPARAKWPGWLASRFGIDVKTPAPAVILRLDTFDVAISVTDRAPDPLPPLAILEMREAPALVDPPGLSGQHDSAVSVTDLALFTHCPRRYLLTRAGAVESAPVFDPEEARPRRRADPLDASEFGTEVHALLAGIPVPNPSAEAVELADRFHASGLGRRAASTLLVEREFDFLFAVEDLIVSGQIDLWFEDRGKLVLVDYKTDDIDAAQAAERAGSYALQVQLYAMALGRLSGRPADEAYLYLLRPDLAIPVPVTPRALEEAASRVAAFREAQERNEFPLHESKACERCPFYQGACPSEWNGRVSGPEGKPG